jgi:hypothetical protein
VPDGQGGRHRCPHQGLIRGLSLTTRITAATGPLLKRAPGPGSHCDGQEACSPGEVRAGAQSLDGRGRGESTIAKYGSGHSCRVGHHAQGPGTTAPAAGSLGLGAVGEGRIQGTRKSGAGDAARRPPWRLAGRPRGTGTPTAFAQWSPRHQWAGRVGAPSRRHLMTWE